MDGFWAFILWTFLTCSAAFGAGHLMSATNLTRDCDSKGEIVVKDNVMKCELTHKIINGRRVALEKLQ